jgi:hypothetical protein
MLNEHFKKGFKKQARGIYDGLTFKNFDDLDWNTLGALSAVLIFALCVVIPLVAIFVSLIN